MRHPSHSSCQDIDNHSVFVMKDKYHRGWIACFSVKAGHIKYVRDENSITLFSTREGAERAALWAHLNSQNKPEPDIKKGKVHEVTGSGRNRRAVPAKQWSKGNG